MYKHEMRAMFFDQIHRIVEETENYINIDTPDEVIKSFIDLVNSGLPLPNLTCLLHRNIRRDPELNIDRMYQTATYYDAQSIHLGRFIKMLFDPESQLVFNINDSMIYMKKDEVDEWSQDYAIPMHWMFDTLALLRHERKVSLRHDLVDRVNDAYNKLRHFKIVLCEVWHDKPN